jgi:hypothetical protein
LFLGGLSFRRRLRSEILKLRMWGLGTSSNAWFNGFDLFGTGV